MEEMIITTVKGYTVVYKPRDKKFYLKDSEGETVGQGKTQDELEEQAKKLAKRGFKPIAAFRQRALALDMGRVTSINLADQSVRFSDGKDAMKVRLRYGPGLHELTAHNQLIKNRVDALLVESGKIEAQIEELMEQLDKPINLEYFNLER